MTDHTCNTLDSRNHAFNVGIAIDYNPTMALWLAHLAFWAEKNLANNSNIHDGLVWCYDTIEALGDYFPYFTKSQIETMINNSIKAELVVTGNYNRTSYDRTQWYALTPKSYVYFKHLVNKKYLKRLFLSISEKSEMDFREFGNGFPGFRMTIPDTDPDTDPDKKLTNCKPSSSSFIFSETQDRQMLNEKLDEDKRSGIEFLQEVKEHVEKYSDLNFPLPVRQQAAIRLLKKLKKENIIFKIAGKKDPCSAVVSKKAEPTPNETDFKRHEQGVEGFEWVGKWIQDQNQCDRLHQEYLQLYSAKRTGYAWVGLWRELKEQKLKQK